MKKYIAIIDFLWYKKGDIVPTLEVEEHPNWLVYVKESGVVAGDVVNTPSPKPKLNLFDLNNDGVVDEKDLKVAAGALRKLGNRFKKGKKTKK